jgi:UDP-N-acetylglucosamine diphosphorylase / glucose-1-phosphate thymidylyltransferase / UDP-N-acetylgalactosamine diphosphorylase / glucosamine-1-phosphate N-acetyltransferase / galactosamine-1-phosphate N-acetyltransferase
MSLPELWSELPAELVAAAFDAARPWELLGEPLDELLAALPSQAIEIALDPRVVVAGDRLVVGAGTRIAPGATLHGPVRIGRDCEIRTGAFLRGGVWIGDGCVVGANVEVKRSILLDGAQAPHLNYVGDSILGRGVNLGAGAVLSNFRHDGREIVIPAGGERLATGRRKLGALLGDAVAVGCNAVLNPGSIVGAGTQIYTGVQLRAGVYPAGSIVKLRQTLAIGPRRER